MKYLFTILTLLISFFSLSQLSGKVTTNDDPNGSPFVNIKISGTTTGTTTDFDGNYTLDVGNGEYVLIFRCESNTSTYEVDIKKWDISSWFMKYPQFQIKIKFSMKRISYSSDEYTLVIDVNHKNMNHKVVQDIYKYLLNLDEERKIKEVNDRIENIINDLSTTVDKSYRRDDTINEILN